MMHGQKNIKKVQFQDWCWNNFFVASYTNYVAHTAEQFIPCLSLDKCNFNYKEQPDIATRRTLVLFLGCHEKKALCGRNNKTSSRSFPMKDLTVLHDTLEKVRTTSV